MILKPEEESAAKRAAYDEQSPKLIRNERTGRLVQDTPKAAAMRKSYYRKIDEQHGHDWVDRTNQVYHARVQQMTILNTRQVAEYFHVKPWTAWDWMRNGTIPSFRVGSRYFTHDYVVDEIERKARELVNSGVARRMLPRIVSLYKLGRPI
jgi:helix-turn-helix protein